MLAIAATWCSPVLADDAPSVDRGKTLFVEQKCLLCHSAEGKGNPKGPLDDVGNKLSAEDLHKWLTTPKDMSAQAKATRQPPMKASTLAASDLDALVAYLQTLKKGK